MCPPLISCALHDYVETACLYGYQLKILLKNNQNLEGKAVDILTTPEKKEFLLIDCGQQAKVELTDIKQLQVLTPNSRFHKVSF